MARSLLAALTSLLLLTWPAHAQISPTGMGVVLVDGPQFFGHGAGHGECFDLGAGAIKIEANSPPGRTGEVAYLEFVKAVEGGSLPYLLVLISDYSTTAQYSIEAGRYCYDIRVTNRLTDMPGLSRDERPTKSVLLTITHFPSGR